MAEDERPETAEPVPAGSSEGVGCLTIYLAVSFAAWFVMPYCGMPWPWWAYAIDVAIALLFWAAASFAAQNKDDSLGKAE